MVKLYACLIGDWVCLNDDPECTVGEEGKSPTKWWEENAELWAPLSREKDIEHSFYGLDYVNIVYKGRRIRINPAFIQVET